MGIRVVSVCASTSTSKSVRAAGHRFHEGRVVKAVAAKITATTTRMMGVVRVPSSERSSFTEDNDNNNHGNNGNDQDNKVEGDVEDDIKDDVDHETYFNPYNNNNNDLYYGVYYGDDEHDDNDCSNNHNDDGNDSIGVTTPSKQEVVVRVNSSIPLIQTENHNYCYGSDFRTSLLWLIQIVVYGLPLYLGTKRQN